MTAAYPHLRIEREQPVNQRRPKGAPRVPIPTDILAHGRKLQASLHAAVQASKEDVGGFDDRPLFKLQLGAFSPEEVAKGFPGVEIISQEDGGYALAFVNQRALEEFEARLIQLASGGKPKYATVLHALQAFDHWTPEDRKGWALKRDGLPLDLTFILDVELWPLGRRDERQAMVKKFEAELNGHQIAQLDKINNDGLIAYRVRTTQVQADLLLRSRDVRTVDLPPKLGLDLDLLQLDIKEIAPIPAPADDAPVVAVLDSGITGAHPLLKDALADAQGFVKPDLHAHDDEGHGTHVAGITLYGDIEECARSKTFVPQLRLLSGRILDSNADADPKFIENIVEEAVKYFHDNYDCRVYNLSYGDLNKPYLGRRIGGLAYTLDRLSRELDVLFVVPMGNLYGIPPKWLTEEYPDYLLKDDCRLIDPAPALNAITVGSVARWDRSHRSWRHEGDLPDSPVAERDQPSPFSRSGGSVKGAVKPELVAYGGNLAINPSTGVLTDQWLGELSTSKDFLNGRLVAERKGTSFAVPHIAHAAARLQTEVPKAGNNLLRALLIANARIPKASADLLNRDEDKLSRLVGYGMIDTSGLYRSTEEQVILIAEAGIPNERNHFYEIPIPDSFYNSGRKSRRREITVSLAHCPVVRTTRLDYKASRLYFRLIKGRSLEEAVAACDKATRDEVDSISELGGDKYAYGATKRSYGTVQAATWAIKRSRDDKLFVVVTRNDTTWGEEHAADDEPYALVVRIADLENEEPRLYTEIRVLLQAREQARERARTRVRV